MSGGARPFLLVANLLVSTIRLIPTAPQNAPVANGHSKKIKRQVFESSHPIANRFTMHHPLLLPNADRNLVNPFSLTKRVAEFGAKDARENLGRQEKVVGCGLRCPRRRYASSRYQIMDMWIIDEVSSPGV